MKYSDDTISGMDLYHVLNRGVDKRTIFEDSQDYVRFVHNLFEFNDTKPAINTFRVRMYDIVSRTSKREKIVDIHGWCLMPNHYHLLLSDKVDGGITKFIKKINIGYAKYFNEKHHRTGTLFQGRTKKILIESDAHNLHILNYIHANPLDLTSAHYWRERAVDSIAEAFKSLKSYRWSSYLDYCGEKNFPSILETKFYNEVFNNKYPQQFERYLRGASANQYFGKNFE